jgi:hypothetical protein
MLNPQMIEIVRGSNDSLAALALMAWIALHVKKQAETKYAGPLSVASLFGRWSRSFKALFRSTGSILQDDLDKTIVSCAQRNSVVLNKTRGHMMTIYSCAVRDSPTTNNSRLTIERQLAPTCERS